MRLGLLGSLIWHSECITRVMELHHIQEGSTSEMLPPGRHMIGQEKVIVADYEQQETQRHPCSSEKDKFPLCLAA